MRSAIVVIISVFILSVLAWAGTSELATDGRGVKMQGCAPTIKNDVAITGNSQTVDVDGANCWKVYVASDTKFRTMSTATKTGVQHTIVGGAWHTEIVNGYKFVNFSTSGATGTARSDKP